MIILLAVPKTAFAIDQTSARLADFLAEYSTESRLAYVGEREAPDRSAIVRKYRDLFTVPSVRSARSLYERAEGELRERARRLYFALLGMNISEQTVELGDKVDAMLLAAMVEVDGERIPYYQAQALAMHERDFAKRERIYIATLAVTEQANPIWRQMLERELEVIQSWGYPGLVELISEQKGIDYPAFQQRIGLLYDQMKELYFRSMEGWVEQALAHKFPGLHRVHSAYLRGLPTHDQHFPSRKLIPAAQATLGKLGFDLSTLPNIHVDTEDRPKKNPRAACFTTRTPAEVHLIIKPTGTQHDYEAFFHEAGHALHYGLTDASLPIEFRELSVSHALTEVYSYAIESITRQPAWLEHRLDIPTTQAREIARDAALVDLMMFARYTGKLAYELGFHLHPLNDSENRAHYAATLTRFSGFRYDPGAYLDDMDSDLYVADYLRAWLTQAMVEEYLRQEFGEEWFTSRGAGEFFRGLWTQGVRLENEDLARQLGYTPWDTAPLARRWERILGGAK